MKDFNRIIRIIPKDAFGLKTEDALERLEKRPLLVPTVILFVACCLTFLTASVLPVFFILANLLAFVIFTAKKRNVTRLLGFVLCSLTVALCGFRILTALKADMPSDCDGIYTGTILSCERKLSGAQRIIANIGGVKVELCFGKDLSPPETVVGAYFAATGNMRDPDSGGNPGEFDYKAYLKGKGILYQFYADSFEYVSYPSGSSRFLSSSSRENILSADTMADCILLYFSARSLMGSKNCSM